MTYKLFTMPACDKCREIKGYLDSAGIEFREVDLGDDEGVAELRKIYVHLKDKIERTEDGQLPIPLFVSLQESTVNGAAHTIAEVEELLNG